MCGCLKCCFNYELDIYFDVLQQFFKNVDKLQMEVGIVIFVKMDIFKGFMYYVYQKDFGWGKFYIFEASCVKDIKVMNWKGEKFVDLVSLQVIFEADSEEEVDMGFEDVIGVIELLEEKCFKKC